MNKYEAISDRAVAELQAANLGTPGAVTTWWQRRWQTWGDRIGLEILVPEFPDTEEDLSDAIKRGDKPFFVPDSLATQAQRHLLGKIWPAICHLGIIDSRAVDEDTTVTNEVEHVGWRYTEYSINAPHLSADEHQLRESFQRRGREGLNITEYIIASQDSKLLTGQYFDQGATWSRLLSSRYEGKVAYAFFYPENYMYAHVLLTPEYHLPSIGGRSSQGMKS